MCICLHFVRCFIPIAYALAVTPAESLAAEPIQRRRDPFLALRLDESFIPLCRKLRCQGQTMPPVGKTCNSNGMPLPASASAKSRLFSTGTASSPAVRHKKADGALAVTCSSREARRYGPIMEHSCIILCPAEGQGDRFCLPRRCYTVSASWGDYHNGRLRSASCHPADMCQKTLRPTTFHTAA